MNWASIVKTAVPQSKGGAQNSEQPPGLRSEVIVDTNAIMRGVQLERFACRALTVQEVLNEVRDKKSRAWLDRIPFGVDVEDADEEDIKAVTKFARATGDLSFLSKVDIQVISLTRARERALNGSEQIKEYPGQVKVESGGFSMGSSQPGWGSVPNPEDWAAMDELNQLEEDRRLGKVKPKSEAAKTSPDASFSSDLVGQNESHEDSQSLETMSPAHLNVKDVINESTTKNDRDTGQQLCEEMSRTSVEELTHQLSRSASEESSSIEDMVDESLPLESCQISQHTDGNSQPASPGSPAKSTSNLETHDVPAGLLDISDLQNEPLGTVACMTSDFSMQNVLIQMGLRVLTPDGRRIKEVKKWGMRCSACFYVTKQVGRIFCARCGKASLQRVELCTREDGTEVYGVRTKHILRGTKYSLPMPKGGKKNRDPILSEDMLLLRTKHLNTPNKVSIMDPFTPEYSDDTWFKKSSVEQKVRELLPNRRNPNERRRGKRRK